MGKPKHKKKKIEKKPRGPWKGLKITILSTGQGPSSFLTSLSGRANPI